jgi:CPA2 family monovalent cation:H+ antiporter-2
VLQNIRAIREERYALFRGFFHGATDVDANDDDQPRLHTVVLPERAHATGRTLDELDLAGVVDVTGVRRRSARSVRPPPDWRFEPGDAVVLLGRPADIARAERRLLEG